MGWSVGEINGRWVGYGVPAVCDYPSCGNAIDRGLAYACGGGIATTLDSDQHCDRFFCGRHLAHFVEDRDPNGGGGEVCDACAAGLPPYPAKPDTEEWVTHVLTDDSWETWRAENPERVKEMSG